MMIRPVGYCQAMNQDTLIQHENAFWHAVKDGPVTEAEIRKSTKLDDEQVADLIEYFRGRLWLEVDETGKTPKYVVTNQAVNDMTARYQ